jgi:hypothetical protein
VYNTLFAGHGADILQDCVGWGLPQDGLRAARPMGPTFFVGVHLMSCQIVEKFRSTL